MGLLWPMLILRKQGSLWPIYDADFLGRYVFFFFFFFIKSKSSNKK